MNVNTPPRIVGTQTATLNSSTKVSEPALPTTKSEPSPPTPQQKLIINQTNNCLIRLLESEAKSVSSQQDSFGKLGDASQVQRAPAELQNIASEHGLGAPVPIQNLENASFSQGLKNLVGRNMHVQTSQVVDGEIRCVITSRDGSRSKDMVLPKPVNLSKEAATDMLKKLDSGSFSGSKDLDGAILRTIKETAGESNSPLSNTQVSRGYEKVHERLFRSVELDVTRMRPLERGNGDFAINVSDSLELKFHPQSVESKYWTEFKEKVGDMISFSGSSSSNMKFRALPTSNGLVVVRESGRLHVMGEKTTELSTFGKLTKLLTGEEDKPGKTAYKTLPRPDELLTAKDIREIKRHLSVDSYREILSNARPNSTNSDDTLLKWAKRIDRWEKSGPVSKFIAKIVEKCVGNPERLKTIIEATRNEYAMLYENLEGRFLEKPVGIMGELSAIGTTAKDVSSNVKSQLIKMKGLMNQFKSLEVKINMANKQLGGAAQDAVNLMATTSTALDKFQSTFDPKSVNSEAEFKKLFTLLNEAEQNASDSIGKAIKVVSNDLVPLLSLDKSGTQVDPGTKRQHLESAQKKITGLEKMYLFISRDMDQMRVPLLAQQATHIETGETQASQTLSITLSTVKEALGTLTDITTSKSDKSAAAYDALYGEHGVSKALTQLENDVSLQGQDGADTVKAFLTECRSVLADIGTPKMPETLSGRLAGSIGTHRDPVLFALASKREELMHYNTSLTQFFDIQAELISAGNTKVTDTATKTEVRLSPKTDAILSEFQKAGATVFSEKALSDFSPDQWSDTSNQLLRVQDQLRGEMLRLSLLTTPGISEAKDKLLDVLENANTKIDQFLDSHAAFPEKTGKGTADPKLDAVRQDSSRLFSKGLEASFNVRESGKVKLTALFEKVVQFNRLSDVNKLRDMITNPTSDLTAKFLSNPELKPSLETFIEEARKKLLESPNKTDVILNLRSLKDVLSGAAGKDVDVYSVRIPKGTGSIVVTINRDKSGAGEQDTKEVVFSPTGMVKEDANRFTTVANNPTAYKEFLGKLQNAAEGYERIQAGRNQFKVLPPAVPEIVIAPPVPLSASTIMEPKTLARILSGAPESGPPVTLWLQAGELGGNRTTDIPHNDREFFRVIQSKDKDGVTQLTVSKMEKRIIGFPKTLESSVVRVVDSSVSPEKQAAIMVSILDNPDSISIHNDLNQSDIFTKGANLLAREDIEIPPNMANMSPVFALINQIGETRDNIRAELGPKIKETITQLSHALEGSMAKLEEDLSKWSRGQMKDADINSPFMHSREAFLKEMTEGLDSMLSSPEASFLLTESKDRLTELALNFYVKGTMCLINELYKGVSQDQAKEIGEAFSAELPKFSIAPTDGEVDMKNLKPLMDAVYKKVEANQFGTSELFGRVQNEFGKKIALGHSRVAVETRIEAAMSRLGDPMVDTALDSFFSGPMKGGDCARSALQDALSEHFPGLNIKVLPDGTSSTNIVFSNKKELDRFCLTLDSKIDTRTAAALKSNQAKNTALGEVMTDRVSSLAYSILNDKLKVEVAS
jgi:hypothetical protein